MQYREWPPHPALARFVRAYWALRDGGAAAPQPVLPDGSSELVVHRERPFYRHTAERGRERQAPLLLVGQMRAPVVLESDGAADVVAIRFRPHGAFALLGLRQDALLDTIADVGALGLGWLRRAMVRAREADTQDEAIACLESALLARAARRDVVDPRLPPVLGRLEETAGALRVEEAAALAGVSPRHLERLFREQVGLAPKTLGRLLRFQAAAARIVAAPAAPLAAVSADSGYFDQSHMIRDFLDFAGASPDQMRQRLGALTAGMLRGD